MNFMLLVFFLCLSEASKLGRLIKVTRAARLYSARSSTDAIDDARRVISNLYYSETVKDHIIACVADMYTVKNTVITWLLSLPRIVVKPKQCRTAVDALIASLEEVVGRMSSSGAVTVESVAKFKNQVTQFKGMTGKVYGKVAGKAARARILWMEIVSVIEALDTLIGEVWIFIAELLKDAGGNAKETMDAINGFRRLRYWEDAVTASRYAFKHEDQFHTSLQLAMKSERFADKAIKDYSRREMAWYCQQLHSEISDFFDSMVNTCMVHCYTGIMTLSEAEDSELVALEEVHTDLLGRTMAFRDQMCFLSDDMRNSLDSLCWFSRPVNFENVGRFKHLSLLFFESQDEYLSLQTQTGNALDQVLAKVFCFLSRHL